MIDFLISASAVIFALAMLGVPIYVGILLGSRYARVWMRSSRFFVAGALICSLLLQAALAVVETSLIITLAWVGQSVSHALTFLGSHPVMAHYPLGWPYLPMVGVLFGFISALARAEVEHGRIADTILYPEATSP